MNADIRIDSLIDEVVADLANPTLSAAFEAKLRGITDGSDAMSTAAMGNVIAFNTFDRMKDKGARKTVAWAVFAHAAALLLVMSQVRAMRMTAPSAVTSIEFTEPVAPPPAPPKMDAMGGGGGQPDKTPVTQGNPPKFAPEQLNPPKVPVDAKLTPPATVDVQTNLKMAKSEVPQFGMPNSPLVGMSMGNGKGTGMGSGDGPGIGVGGGGNMGGKIRSVGGSVSAPVVLFAPEPMFSEEARKQKVGGNVLVYLQVDANGRPMHERVLRGIGMGLDERALEAVKQYRFKPAMENGKPVAVEMNVEVTFTIY
jgi:protein TonB